MIGNSLREDLVEGKPLSKTLLFVRAVLLKI